MRKAKLGLGLVAVVSLVGAPSTAAAQTVIPPGNSAVNQYTQTFPTAGGNSPTQNRGSRSPAKVLGGRNAQRLDAKGPAGRAAASLAAATAPTPAVLAAGRGRSGGAPGAQGASHTDGAGQGIGGASTGSETSGSRGSSGFDQVIGQATGSSSSGQMGFLLPLVIVAAVLWSLMYLWRQRRRAA